MVKSAIRYTRPCVTLLTIRFLVCRTLQSEAFTKKLMRKVVFISNMLILETKTNKGGLKHIKVDNNIQLSAVHIQSACIIIMLLNPT